MQNKTEELKQQNDLVLSHLGLHVKDIEKMTDFYEDVLDFTLTDRGDVGNFKIVFLSRDPTEHHQLALISGRAEGNYFNLLNQISFRVPNLKILRAFYHRAVANDFISEMTAASHGNTISIYFRDPEGNRIEIFMDTPWHCAQPLRINVDFSLDDESLLNNVQTIASQQPEFQPRQQWAQAMRKKMDYH